MRLISLPAASASGFPKYRPHGRFQGATTGLVVCVIVLAVSTLQAAPPTPVYTAPSSWGGTPITWQASEMMGFCTLTGTAQSTGATYTVDGQNYTESLDLTVTEKWSRPNATSPWKRDEVQVAYSRVANEFITPALGTKMVSRWHQTTETFGAFPSKTGWENSSSIKHTDPSIFTFTLDGATEFVGLGGAYVGDDVRIENAGKYWMGGLDPFMEIEMSAHVERVIAGGSKIPVMIQQCEERIQNGVTTTIDSVEAFGFHAGGPSMNTRYQQTEGFACHITETIATIMGVPLNNVKYYQWSRLPTGLSSQTEKVHAIHWEHTNHVYSVDESAFIDYILRDAEWQNMGVILHEVYDIDVLGMMEMMELMQIQQFIEQCKSAAQGSLPY